MLAKTKLNSISKSLIDSYINNDEFVLTNIVLKEYGKTNNLKTS